MSPPRGLSNPVHHVDPNQREPLAVIGIGCRFPGGLDSPVALWDALLGGINAIRDVPEDRWKHDRFHDTNPEKVGSIRNAKGGFIDGVDQFDGDFFGYFPNEAQRIARNIEPPSRAIDRRPSHNDRSKRLETLIASFGAAIR